MFVNSIGPVNAINMVSKVGAAPQTLALRLREDADMMKRLALSQPVQPTMGIWWQGSTKPVSGSYFSAEAASAPLI